MFSTVLLYTSNIISSFLIPYFIACLISLFLSKSSSVFIAIKSYSLPIYSFLLNPIFPIYSSVLKLDVEIKISIDLYSKGSLNQSIKEEIK